VRAFDRADSSLDDVNRTFIQHRDKHSGRDQQGAMSALGVSLESALKGFEAGRAFVAGLRCEPETATIRDYSEQREGESRKPGMLQRMTALLRAGLERSTSKMRRKYGADTVSGDSLSDPEALLERPLSRGSFHDEDAAERRPTQFGLQKRRLTPISERSERSPSPIEKPKARPGVYHPPCVDPPAINHGHRIKRQAVPRS